MAQSVATRFPTEGAAPQPGDVLRVPEIASRVSEGPTSALTKKATLNTIAAVLDLAARMTVEFLMTPLLVAGLGEALFGTWRVLWRLIGSFSITSGRSAQALKMAIANRQSSADYVEKRRFVASAVVIWLAFAPLYWILGGIVIWLLPSLLSIPSELWLPTRWAAGVLLANMMLLSLADVPRAILKGENLGYKRMGLSSLLVMLCGGLMLAALYLGWGIVGLAVANFLSTLLTGVLFLQVVRSHVAWLGLARPSWEALRWFFGLSWWFIGWKFVMQAMMAGDVVVLGVFASVEHVAVYSLTKYVPELLPLGVALIVSAMAPGLGRIVGSGDTSKAAAIRGEVMTFTWLVLTVAGTTILLWNESFVRLWVGQDYYAGAGPTLLILLMVTQRALIRNDANFIDLTLRVRAKTIVGLVATLISLTLAAILVGYFEMGIAGVCIGLIVGRLPLSLAYPWQVGEFVNQSLVAQAAAAARPAATTALLFFLAMSFGDVIGSQTWLATLGGILTTAMAVLIFSALFGLGAYQRNRLLKRIRKIARFS